MNLTRNLPDEPTGWGTTASYPAATQTPLPVLSATATRFLCETVDGDLWVTVDGSVASPLNGFRLVMGKPVTFSAEFCRRLIGIPTGASAVVIRFQPMI
jgi:hypothetical protein